MSGELLLLLAIVVFLAWLIRPGRRSRDPSDLEKPDHDELEAAEREVRDLGVQQRPEDGFEGDDWGPGAGNPRVR
ncbi:MAG TPA: hypothetical protein VLA89_08105 [Gemmatimonadales bacterium]|nr:hypothetical protein [Gemmatimonadales bacterium]